MKRAILYVTFAALCGAQTTVNGGRDYKGTLKASGSVSAVDFSGAGGTAPAKAGTLASRPTACTQGQVYFATDVAAGQNLYFCTVTGAPGVWTQMSGSGATAMTAGPGAPSGNCNPPVLYIDTTNQDLWFCSATNSWKKPTADTSGLPTLAGSNTWTGYSNLSSGQWRPPESTVSNLPSATGNVGKVFMVTDAVSAGSCSTGGGSLRELCRANGSTYECVGGCGSAGGGSGTAAYISALLSGPDMTRTIAGGTHGFATTALLVAVYDNASPRNVVSVRWTVNPSTYDVTVAFASPQSNYYVVINGGVGPQGATGTTGVTGATGPAGPAPSGTGIVKVISGSAGLAVAGTDFAAATNGTNGQALTSNGAGGFGTPATLATVATSGSASDLGAGTLPAARLPNPGASAKGGVQSKDCTGTGHILSINTDGTSTCSADSGGGGSGIAAYVSTLITDTSLTHTITGATHGFVSTGCPLVVSVWDNSTPQVEEVVGVSKAASTCDVTITFASTPDNYYVVINGGVGPQGTTGAAGAAGSNGANGQGYTWKGAYSGATAYVPYDTVSYSGSSYVCILASTGNLPTNGTYFAAVAQKGNDGAGSGTVTSASFTGGLVSVSSPTTTPAFSVAGTSGGIPYFSGATTWVSSAALGAGQFVLGGGSGSAPATSFSVIPVPNGGTGTGSTLTGLVRGSASAMTAAELSGDVTTSGSNAVTIVANAVSASKMAVVNTRRICVIDNDSQSATALTAAQITGRCEVPFAAHIIEVGVWGGTGTGTQTYTGTSSVQLTRYRPNGATTATVLSAALATPGSGANKACAMATTSGTCINGLTSSGSITLAGGVTAALAAGDVLYVSSATADGAQTWYTITITYTVD